MTRSGIHRKKYYVLERLCYFALALFFFADLFLKRIPEQRYRIFFLAIVIFYTLQQFLYETCFFRFDGAFHYKNQKKRYRPNSAYRPRPVERKGIGAVLIIYTFFVVALIYLQRGGLLTWPLYMSGACLILMMNNIFIYYKCPFQEFLLKGVVCCSNCHISAWDYIIFATGLLFVPDVTPWIIWTARALWLFSLVIFVRWESVLRRHPERFVPAGNSAIGCRACGKSCTVPNSWRFAIRVKL